MNIMINSNFPKLGEPRRGKVRDIYDLDDFYLMVVTDRVSAYDVVMPQGIPGKGETLTKISNKWFGLTEDIILNHVVSTDAEEFATHCPAYAEALEEYKDQLQGRATLVKKVTPLPVEAIVRGYISGSGWKDYQSVQAICGIELPAGLVESQKLPKVLFTPSTKAEMGLHDENITFQEVMDEIGLELAEEIKLVSLKIYNRCAGLALEQGIIIADTKFEFGIIDDELILIDEILTPDSSRFWPKDTYKPGGPQKSFDKQYLRDWLSTLDWDKTAPAPNLPEEVIEGTRKRYAQALSLISQIQ
ncbi:MAG: phosphoribosylaminoimidazolesuccinocarboxamide synthase [Patescibacteria group bacterium]|jgi:phosphoribosylaminoimidazole-succinocarboxamide synthase|nr:phosphoribosylaminoimidazolesuccinocarboxamide synthase [Patescibacteria group bacterium]